jgi:hypothetical protein
MKLPSCRVVMMRWVERDRDRIKRTIKEPQILNQILKTQSPPRRRGTVLSRRKRWEGSSPAEVQDFQLIS